MKRASRRAAPAALRDRQVQPLVRAARPKPIGAQVAHAGAVSPVNRSNTARPGAAALSMAAAPVALEKAVKRNVPTLHARAVGLVRGLSDRWLLAALAITLGALGLRLVGIGFGLPAHFHWDEPTIINRAIRMGGGDFNPHFFYYPGLSFYITFASEAALYLVGHLLHVYTSANAFAAAYFTDSTPFYLVGRVVGALIGAATCLVCYLVGKRFFSPLIGVLAAVLLAVSPVGVANAHFITNDVPMAFFALLAYVWIWQVYAQGRQRDYVLAGLAIGLGIATKYLPAILLVSLVLAHVLHVHREAHRWVPRWDELKPLALAAGAALLTFFAASPYSFLDWHDALHDYTTQAQLSSAAGVPNAPLNVVPYLSGTLPWSIGWPAYVGALVGLVAVVRARGERRWELLFFISFPLLFFLMIGSARQPWARWLVTLQPFLALGAVAVSWWCAQQAPALWQRLMPRSTVRRSAVTWGALGALMLCLVVPPAVTSLHFDSYLLHADPRTQATQWFEQHVPTTTTVAIQPLFDRYFFTAPIMTTGQLAQLEHDIPAGKTDVVRAVDAYYHARPLYPDVPFVYDLAALRAQGVRYIVLSSATTHNTGDVAAEDRFYAALRNAGTVVARFAPAVDLSDASFFPVSSPTITVYVLPAVVR